MLPTAELQSIHTLLKQKKIVFSDIKQHIFLAQNKLL